MATGPEVAVGAIVVHGGRLLLIRRAEPPGAGQWSVPGGRVMAGETVHEAVVREVVEETGLEVVVDRFLGWVERIDADGGYHYVILDFAAQPVEPEPEPEPQTDADRAQWVDLGALDGMNLVDGLLEFLEDAGVLERTRTFEL